MDEDRDSVIDQIIRDGMAQGRFKNLPGEGKPLKLEEDPYTPPHLRLAHKILSDNDMVPEWIAEGKELEATRKVLLKAIQKAAKHYLSSYEDPAKVEARWQMAVHSFNVGVKRLNSGILGYNLKIPNGITPKQGLLAEKEIRRALDAAKG
jgi:DnaJ homolog subfamily C member 28